MANVKWHSSIPPMALLELKGLAAQRPSYILVFSKWIHVAWAVGEEKDD